MAFRASWGKLLAPAALWCLSRHGPAVSKLPLSMHMPTRCLGGLRCLPHSSRADLEERGILQESPADEPWTVRVPDEEGLLGELSAVTVAKAAAAIQTVGFAVLRGASVLRSGELCAAQAEADEALEEIKATAQNLGLEPLAPWATPKPTPGAGNLFRFQEASSFSSGRLDMTLEDAKPSGPLATRQDLLRLCEALFDTDCQLASRGAFWNFPGSGREHWHRDGLMPLLTVVTAARQYPSDAGFMRLQPFTQTGAIDEDSESGKEPKAAAGESERVAATLRPGELLLFLYSAKHAAVPNFSEFDRCLLYSVYGPKGPRQLYADACNKRGRGGQRLTSCRLFDGVLFGFRPDTDETLDQAQADFEKSRASGDQRTQSAALLAYADAAAAQEQASSLSLDPDDSAVRLAREAFNQLQDSGDSEGQAAALHVLAKAHLARSSFAEAMQAAEEALQRFEALGHATGHAATLNVLAQSLLREDPEAALKHATAGRDAFRRLGDSRRASMLERTAVGASLACGDTAHALKDAEASVASCRRDAGDRRDEAAALALLAEVRHAREEFHLVVPVASEAAEIFARCGDQRNQAAALHSAASAALAADRATDARRLAAQAQDVLRSLLDRAREVSARGIVVQAEIALGNNEQALEIASEGLLAMQQQGDYLSLAEAHRHIAAAQLASSLPEEARQSAMAARNSSERLLGTRKWECKADALELLAEICRQTKDFQAMTQAAEELAECCREAAWPRREALALRTVTRGHLAMRKPRSALEAAGRAMTLFRETGNSSAADEMRLLFARATELRNSMRDAARNARQAWLLFRERGDPSLLFQAAKNCHDAHHMFDDENVLILEKEKAVSEPARSTVEHLQIVSAAAKADKARRRSFDPRGPEDSTPAHAQLKLHVVQLEEVVSQVHVWTSKVEADVLSLNKRKEELERQNEALAQRPELEKRVKELQAEVQQLHQRTQELEKEKEAVASERQRLEDQLTESQANCTRLEEECRQHAAERERRAELENQQADVARSFAELQAVVAQLLPWLGELDTQRSRLLEEKGHAEAMATSLRSELQRWRMLWGSVPSTAVNDAASRPSSAGRMAPPARASRRGPGNQRRAASAAGEKRGDTWNRRPSPCRLRLSPERPDWAVTWPPNKEGAATPGASEVLAALSAELAKAAKAAPPAVGSAAASVQKQFALQLQELLAPMATKGSGAVPKAAAKAPVSEPVAANVAAQPSSPTGGTESAPVRAAS
ncbi:unnamed protein product [Symbiodinium sp. CCMP2592]|nr:unnamed protein product [Symbiodinium sp. CCMP2592]